MKNIIVLLTMASLLFSCKENIVDGFDADSIKKKIETDLNGSEWTNNAEGAYYEKIEFMDGNLRLTRKGALISETFGYVVSNVFGPQETLPKVFLLRPKTPLPTNELYLSSDYSLIQSVIKLDAKSDVVIRQNYLRVDESK